MAERLTGDPDVAQDLVQRVCLSILVARPGWCRRSVTGWAASKLRSEVDHWRQGEYRRSLRRGKATVELNPRPESPAEHLERNLVWTQVQRALRTLPPRRRRVWESRHLDGMGVREIAEALGISVKTVENTLLAARAQLRAALMDTRDEG